MGNVKRNVQQPTGRWSMAAWVVAGFILLLPLGAKQLSEEVLWTGNDFVFAGILLFVPLAIYQRVAATTADTAYRSALATALGAAALLVWVSGAVGITDGGGDAMYFIALAAGACGAVFARFRPRGMARAMTGTALALGSAGTIALTVGAVAPYNSALEILAVTGFFVALFAVSAALFRASARNPRFADRVCGQERDGSGETPGYTAGSVHGSAETSSFPTIARSNSPVYIGEIHQYTPKEIDQCRSNR